MSKLQEEIKVREIIDEFIEVLSEMWDRSDNEETEVDDIILPLKAALLVAEIDANLKALYPEPDTGFLKKSFKILKTLKTNKKPKTYFGNKKLKKRFSKF